MQQRALTTAVAVATLAAAGCASGPPRLTYQSLPSASAGGELPYAVYAPRDLGPEERLPLVVFLHGGGDGADCFDEADVGQYLDAQLLAGTIPRVVIVVPDGGRGFWENWQDGSYAYRDAVVRELVPAVRARYHTLDCPEDCHVMGVSMGGYGALRFALLEPASFASVSALSAPIFDTQRMLEMRDSFWFRMAVPVDRIWGEDPPLSQVQQDDLFLRWRSQEDLRGLQLLLAWGSDDRDGIIASNRKFDAHLTAHAIDHIGVEFQGPHKWTAWTPVIARALREQVRKAPRPSTP